MGWFLVQAKTFQGLSRRKSVLIPAVMSIELINHAIELVAIDRKPDHVRGAPALGFVEVAMVERVPFAQVVEGKPFP